jgi:hypothetical protein
MAETAKPGALTRPARRSPLAKGISAANHTALVVLAGRPLQRPKGVRPTLTAKRRRRAKGMADCLAQIRRCLRTMPERSDFDVTTLADLRDLTANLDDAIRAGVQHSRRLGYSWVEIGRELGVSKQTAHERWGP